MRTVRIVFIILIWLVLAAPFAGMSVRMTTQTTENKSLSVFPDWRNGENWNYQFLQQLGAFFEDHFAFRPEMVNANALIQSKVLHFSASNQVIVGTDNWLYYSGTLKDYLGTKVFNERQWYSLEHNLSLMQQYAEQHGSSFLFMVVPNKNSLYSKNMPYFYRKGRTSNLNELQKKLTAREIRYLDLYNIFRKQDNTLYYKKDTHWNTKGALLGYNSLMNSFDIPHESYKNAPTEWVKHIGDIDTMLFPLSTTEEIDIDYSSVFSYHYCNSVSDNMDEWIETACSGKTGTLLMYRDSFGERIIPFIADNVGHGYFSRLVPYNLSQIEQYSPDYLVIERAERGLTDLIEKAAILEPSPVELVSCPEISSDTTIQVERQGSWLFFSGIVDVDLVGDKSDVFLSIRESTGSTKTYPVFYTSSKSKGGYQLYIKDSSINSDHLHVNIIVNNNHKYWIVSSKDIVLGKE